MKMHRWPVESLSSAGARSLVAVHANAAHRNCLAQSCVDVQDSAHSFSEQSQISTL